MNIGTAVLPFVNVCQISNRMASSPESPWPSLPAPPGAQNTWPVPLSRRSKLRRSLQAWTCNLCSQQSSQWRGSEGRKTTRYGVEGKTKKKKNEVKIKIENMARHDQTELNIRAGRRPKQNTIIDQHTQYPDYSNPMSSIFLPVCTKIHRGTTSQSDIPFLSLTTDLEARGQVFQFLLKPRWLQLCISKTLNWSEILISVATPLTVANNSYAWSLPRDNLLSV